MKTEPSSQGDEDADELYRFSRDRIIGLRGDWAQKWVLSLAVGNGAGLVLLAGALVKGWPSSFWLAALPAMWAFALGLIASGAVAFTYAQRYSHAFTVINVIRKAQLAKIAGDSEHAKLLSSARRSLKYPKFWQKASGFLSAVASICFVFGSLWPLLVVTFKISQ
jgi:hypothetical protein